MKKYYLLTPGPTPVPPEVLAKTSLPILHHRTTEFGRIFIKVLEDLKYVFQTKKGISLLLTSSGTGAMESAVVNTVSPGEKVLVVEAGNFGERWGKICQSYGLEVVTVSAEWGKAVDPEDVRQALKKDSSIRAVLTTHTDTSTGTLFDIESYGKIVSETDAILVVDAISGLGGDKLLMDQWKCDVVVSGSQKGLMTPPGLAFVGLSEKGWERVEKSRSPRFYWDYRSIRKSIADKETPFTPAVSLVMGLSQALDMIRQEGLENVWERHKRLAHEARDGMRALGLRLFSAAPCHVLTAAYIPEGVDGKKIVKHLRDQYGVSVAGGQARLSGKIVRLAHMGFMDSFDLVIGLDALKKGLADLGYVASSASKAKALAK